jgi:eukaryotic-like serine/threonine-protein kinase
MDSARWEQIQALFHDVVGRPESERQAVLEMACGDDAELMAEVLSMLEADSRSTSLLDRGLPEVAYRMVGATLEPGPSSEFGPYRLLRSLGEGGMGVVWLAERTDAGNRVAIKFLPHAGLSPARRERFAREIKTLGKLKHPFIARLYDAGALDDGTPWFVMEYVEGVRFTEFCRRNERPIQERLQLFRSVCEAVQYAHGQEIIHRDLKPSNILVEQDGTPRLLDFGVAKQIQSLDEPVEQTRPALRFVSLDYAAPEWVRDGSVGFYTDVYSLGVTLYEMLSGRLPFEQTKRSPDGARTGAVEAHPAKPSLAASGLAAAPGRMTGFPPLSKADWSDLDVLCLKAMHWDARKRYPSVEALIRDIDHYLKNEPLEARPDTLGYRARKFLRRNWRVALASAAVFALLAGLSVFYTVRLARARDAALMQAARTKHIERFMLSMFAGDRNSGPSENLRVVTMLDRGVQQAHLLKMEPGVQAELYETLGGIYESLGDLDRADSLLQTGLEKRRSIFGQDSEEVADGLVELSTLRVDQAKFGEAERLAREAVAIDRRKLPAGRPALGIALSTLGEVLEHRGMYDEAIRVLEEAVRLQSTPPAETADLVESLTFLSDTQHLAGHDTVAESSYQRVLTLDRQIYDDHHPSVAEDLCNLGQIKEGLGRYDEAERYERQALGITQAWYGKDHLESALDAEALAKTLVYEHKYDEAAELLKQALTTQQRDVGKNHPFVALAWNWLGVVALKGGKLDEAEADFRHMAEIYRSVYGEKDNHAAVALSRFGELCMARNQYSRAQQLFQQSVQTFSETLSPDSFKTGVARAELGRALLREQQYREAEGELLAGYKIVTGEGHSSTEEAMDARRDLVALYETLKLPEKAAKFRAELAADESGKAVAATQK